VEQGLAAWVETFGEALRLLITGAKDLITSVDHLVVTTAAARLQPTIALDPLLISVGPSLGISVVVRHRMMCVVLPLINEACLLGITGEVRRQATLVGRLPTCMAVLQEYRDLAWEGLAWEPQGPVVLVLVECVETLEILMLAAAPRPTCRAFQGQAAPQAQQECVESRLETPEILILVMGPRRADKVLGQLRSKPIQAVAAMLRRYWRNFCSKSTAVAAFQRYPARLRVHRCWLL